MKLVGITCLTGYFVFSYGQWRWRRSLDAVTQLAISHNLSHW